VRRRLTATVAAWAVGLAVFRVGMVPPERCPAVTLPELRTGALAARDWIERAPRPDGTYVYEYDRRTNEDLGGYNEVRHAGVTMSLFQLAAAGEPSVLAAADRGLATMTANLLRVDGWAAYAPPGGSVKLGASALLLAGLAYRRMATADPRYDALMREIGGFFRSLQLPNGSFLAYYDANARQPIPGVTSLYSTGEAFFGFTLLANAFPGEGWDASARLAAHYVATDRDEDEGQRLGPWADQWSAYALDQMKSWPLTDEEVRYARRLAGRFGLFTRGESQKREGGVQHLIRLDPARGAGFGTVVEGVTSLWRLAGAEPRLADLQAPLAERARCAAGITASRQVDASQAQRWADPDRVLGAWFSDDRTRMDDQQHSLSGLIRAEAVLGAPDAFAGAA
jgi:hypothetical protein